MMESGVPDDEVSTFIGMMAAAATPAAIVARLNAAIDESLQTAEVVAAAARLNADVRPASAAAFAAFLANEREKWTEAVRLAGIKLQE